MNQKLFACMVILLTLSFVLFGGLSPQEKKNLDSTSTIQNPISNLISPSLTGPTPVLGQPEKNISSRQLNSIYALVMEVNSMQAFLSIR